jgi:hypothetical protein
VLVTVATSDDPHLERVTGEWTQGATTNRWTYRVSELGTATVDRPGRVPATVERFFWRADKGMQRLASWVGF